MRDGFTRFNNAGNDVLAEIMAGVRIGSVFAQQLEHEFGFENIDAHAGQREVGIARHGRWISRLFDEIENVVLVVDMHHAKAGRFHAWHFDTANRDISTTHHVLLDHQGIVLLVNVVTSQNDDIFCIVAGDNVDVLEHRIGGALVPVLFVELLRSGQDVQRFIALCAEETPAPLQVTDQGMCLVLCGNTDAPDPGIDRIGQGEIDNAAFATKINGGLGPGVPSVPSIGCRVRPQEQTPWFAETVSGIPCP